MLSSLPYIKSFLKNRIPSQLVIQLTNRCNARCPQCGMRVDAKFPRSTLPQDDLKKMVDAAAAKGVRALSLTGGEPLLYLDQVIELATHASNVGIPFVRTGTNGYLFRNSHKPDFQDRIKRLAERLVGANIRNFWISIDSAYAEVHEQMRGLKGVVAGIEKALPIFHAAGLYPSANLGINRRVAGAEAGKLHRDHFSNTADYLNAFYACYSDAFDQFYYFVRQLGFTIVNACYPMSIGEEEQTDGMSAVYAATAEDDVVRFTASEKAMLYKALMDTIPRHRRHIRIFTPLSSLYMLHRQYVAPHNKPDAMGCRGGIDFFFVSAEDGNTYPCGYRGHENLGKFWELDIASLNPDEDCHRCDWECFRDPSEMSAPLLQGLSRPLELSRRLYKDPVFLKQWLRDLRYYRSCGLFDGRKPLESGQLYAF